MENDSIAHTSHIKNITSNAKLLLAHSMYRKTIKTKLLRGETKEDRFLSASFASRFYILLFFPR